MKPTSGSWEPPSLGRPVFYCHSALWLSGHRGSPMEAAGPAARCPPAPASQLILEPLWSLSPAGSARLVLPTRKAPSRTSGVWATPRGCRPSEGTSLREAMAAPPDDLALTSWLWAVSGVTQAAVLSFGVIFSSRSLGGSRSPSKGGREWTRRCQGPVRTQQPDTAAPQGPGPCPPTQTPRLRVPVWR